MNRTSLSLSLLAAGVMIASAVHAVPTRLSSNSGEIRDIRYASGNGAAAVVYAASQGGGVFKSTNSGLTWAPTGLNTGYAWNLAVSPLNSSHVYAATDAGLFKTTNAGTSWTQLTFDAARSVAVDPGSAGTDKVLLGATGNGLLRSNDGGTTWTRQSSGLTSTEITHISFQSAGVAYIALDCNYQDLVGSQGDGGWGGVSRSVNTNAATIAWTSFNNGGGAGPVIGTGTSCVRALATNATTVYAGTYNPFGAAGEIYRSTGAGWTGPVAANPNSGNLFGVESIAIDRNSATTIHAGARSVGVWSSPSSGTGSTYAQKVDPTSTEDPDAWTKIYAIESIPALANTILIAARGVGIMRTTTFGNAPANNITWDQATGITADRVRGLANHASAAPNTYWLALEQGAVAKSTNAGATWARFIAGMDFGAPLGQVDMLLSATAIAADPANIGVVLVGTRGGGLLALNGAQNGWTTVGLPVTTIVGAVDHKPQSIVIPTSGLVYYSLFDGPAGGKGGGLMRSSTGPGGLAQTVYPGDIVSCAIPVGAGGSGYRVIQAAGTTAYFLRYDGLPYRSIDNFASNTAPCVTAASTGFERLFFHDIAQNPNTTTTLVGATNKGIYRSTDNGVNWARLNIAAPAGFQQVLSGLAYLGNIVYGITRGGGLFCSSDNGGNWQAVSLGGLPPVQFREIKVLNGAIHVLTDGAGVYNGFAATCP